MANAASAEASPHALRVVTRSRSRKMPSSAATMNPICAIGTSTLAWPSATLRSRKMVAASSTIAAAKPYLNVTGGGGSLRSAMYTTAVASGMNSAACATASVSGTAPCRSPTVWKKFEAPKASVATPTLDERAPPSVVGRAFGAASCPHQEPCRQQGEGETGDFGLRQRLAEQRNHQRGGDDEVHAEDRRIGAHRAGGKAADEIVEPGEDEGAGERPPQRRRIEHERAGRERIENHERAKEPRLRQEEMVGPDTRGSGLLVDEIRKTVADHRHDRAEDLRVHHGLRGSVRRRSATSLRSLKRATPPGDRPSPRRSIRAGSRA